MIRGFRDVNGVPVRFEDIDYVRDAARFNCSPASLKTLIENVRARDGVDFSASQLSTTTRQHVLRSMDYYPPTAQAMSGFLGTVKHSWVNRDADRLIVEQRFVSKRDPRISGQIDSASIVELTADGTLVVDLWDLKTTKWYSTTLIAKDVWKHHPDYAWQLNLCAALLEECHNDEIAALLNGTLTVVFAKPGSTAWKFLATHDYKPGMPIPYEHASELEITCAARRISVRNLYLECIPSDSSYKHDAEARKLGLPEYQKAIIPVERRTADETYAVYFEAMRQRDEAIKAGYAPLCADRWSNQKIDNLRCRHYCSVKDECIAFAHARGESHPVAPLTVALEASIAQAEAV